MKDPLGLPELMDVVSIEDKQEAEQKLRAFIGAVPAKMKEYLKVAWACLNGDSVHRGTYIREFKKVVEAVVAALGAKNSVAHDAAQEAYAFALVEMAPPRRWAINEMLAGPTLIDGQCLPGLLPCGFLVERSAEEVAEDAKNGIDHLRMYGKTYRIIAGSTGFSAKLKTLLESKAAQAAEDARDALMKRTQAIFAQTTPGLNLEKINRNSSGKLGLSIRDEVTVDTASGRTITHFGGVLLIESDGKRIKILDAAGKFTQKALAIRDAQRFLPANTLFSATLALQERVPAEVYRDLRLFHRWLRRCIEDDAQRALRAKKREAFQDRCIEEKRELAARAGATVDWKEWLLRNAEGKALIAFPRWSIDRNEGGETIVDHFPFVAFVAERADGKVRIADFPDRLKNLFRNPKLMELTDPGDRFSGLQYPLVAMLRMAFGMAVSAERAAKAAQSQPKPVTEVASLLPDVEEASEEANPSQQE